MTLPDTTPAQTTPPGVTGYVCHTSGRARHYSTTTAEEVLAAMFVPAAVDGGDRARWPECTTCVIRPRGIGAGISMAHTGSGASSAELADDVVLALSELVTNALQHTAGLSIDVQLLRTAEAVEIRVRSGQMEGIEAGDPDPLQESGRGLLIVDSLANRWGVQGDWIWCSFVAPAAEGAT